MLQIKVKKVKSLQDLISSCKRNGQVFNLQTIAIMPCDRDCVGGCQGKITQNINSIR
jgi:hypothetical protein